MWPRGRGAGMTPSSSSLEEARNLTVSTDLSDPPRRRPEIYNQGSFQKVRTLPSLGISWEALLAVPDTPRSRSLHPQHQPLSLQILVPLQGNHTSIAPGPSPDQLGKPCGRRGPKLAVPGDWLQRPKVIKAFHLKRVNEKQGDCRWSNLLFLLHTGQSQKWSFTHEMPRTSKPKN